MYSLGHIGIRTADLARSLDFYVNALGGTKGKEFTMPSGSHIVFVGFDGFSVELICKPGDDRTPGRNHIAVSVPDIHQAIRRIAASGFSAHEKDIAPMGDSALNCFITGPDGEIIELCQGSL